MPSRMKVTPHLSCGDCPIRYRAVCSKCDQDELELLERIKSYRSYRAGETIAWAGERMEVFGSIVIGAAALSDTLEDGRRQMVGLVMPSDFIGRPGRETSPFDVTAVSDTMICQFRRSEFEKLLETHPHISKRLLEMTMDELDAAREWMTVLGRKTAREKLASLFYNLAMRQVSLTSRAAGTVRFALPITREAIGDYLGLTIETVSRQLTAMRKDGVVQIEGLRNVTVPDLEKLRDEAGTG